MTIVQDTQKKRMKLYFCVFFLYFSTSETWGVDPSVRKGRDKKSDDNYFEAKERASATLNILTVTQPKNGKLEWTLSTFRVNYRKGGMIKEGTSRVGKKKNIKKKWGEDQICTMSTIESSFSPSLSIQSNKNAVAAASLYFFLYFSHSHWSHCISRAHFTFSEKGKKSESSRLANQKWETMMLLLPSVCSWSQTSSRYLHLRFPVALCVKEMNLQERKPRRRKKQSRKSKKK